MTNLSDSEADLYKAELEEHVEGLDAALLRLEDENDPEAVAAAFRHLHSVKGGSAAMGFPTVQQLAHRLEDAFSVIRESGDPPSAELIAVAFDANDQFRRHLDLLSIDGAESPADDIRPSSDLLGRIGVLANGADSDGIDTGPTTERQSSDSAPTPESLPSPPEAPPIVAAPPSPPNPSVEEGVEASIDDLLTASDPTAHISIRLDGALPLIDLKARAILQRVGEFCPVGDPLPPLEHLDTVGFVLTVPLLAVVTREDLDRALAMEGVLGWDFTDPPAPAAERPVRVPADQPVAVVPDLQPPKPDASVSKPLQWSDTDAMVVAPKPPPVSPAPGPTRRSSAERRAQEGVTSLRVGVAALDLLADLAGELVTTRSRLSETVASVSGALDVVSGASAHGVLTQRLLSVEKLLPGIADRETRLSLATVVADMKVANEGVTSMLRDMESRSQLKSELVRVAEDVSSVVGRLQEATIDLRLVPLESVFRRFRRVVRDAALSSGKEVDLVIRGERTGVDKRLIDGLSEPLTHLVRNAIDHGLETSEERARIGKTGRGQLVLSASQQGNSVIIELSDDGRGIDVEQVRSRLIADGRVDAERAGQLVREEILAFLSLPGVTTKNEVTELSGRGVGLDAVQSMISRLHGTVELQTEVGRGTTVSLRLPSAMAIVHSLIVTVGQHHLGIPIEDVREVVSLDEVTITPVGQGSTMLLRGEFLPVVEIQDRLRLPQDEGIEMDRRFAAVIHAGSREVACLIDHAVGTEDLVIKSIGDSLGTRRGLSGASFLGDGNVALIVDAAALVGGIS